MIKRRLKTNVKITILAMCTLTIVFSSLSIMKGLKASNEELVIPVVEETQDYTESVVEVVSIIKPYTDQNTSIDKTYYNKDDESTKQENSLIYYENTYLPNNGIIYKNQNEFDVISVLDGTIVDIKEDELLNTIVYISHNNNLTTIYYGLKDVNLKTNDKISQGDIIGKSTKNKFSNEENSLMFEVNYKGVNINPEDFYNMNIDELN